MPNLPYRPPPGPFPDPRDLARLSREAERLSRTTPGGDTLAVGEVMGQRQYLDVWAQGFWARITAFRGAGRYGFIRVNDGEEGLYPDQLGAEVGTGTTTDVIAWEVNGRADVPTGVKVWMEPNRLGPGLTFLYASGMNPPMSGSASGSGSGAVCDGEIYRLVRNRVECRDGTLYRYEWDEALRWVNDCLELLDDSALDLYRVRAIGCCECPPDSGTGSGTGTGSGSGTGTGTGSAAPCYGCPNTQATVHFTVTGVSSAECNCAAFLGNWSLRFDSDLGLWAHTKDAGAAVCPEAPDGRQVRAYFACFDRDTAILRFLVPGGVVAEYAAPLVLLNRAGQTLFRLRSVNPGRPGACGGFPDTLVVTVDDPECAPPPEDCITVPCCPTNPLPRRLVVTFDGGIGSAACLNGRSIAVDYQGLVGGDHEWRSDCWDEPSCSHDAVEGLVGQQVRVRCSTIAPVWGILLYSVDCAGPRIYTGSAASTITCPNPAVVTEFPRIDLSSSVGRGRTQAVVTPAIGFNCVPGGTITCSGVTRTLPANLTVSVPPYDGVSPDGFPCILNQSITLAWNPNGTPYTVGGSTVPAARYEAIGVTVGGCPAPFEYFRFWLTPHGSGTDRWNYDIAGCVDTGIVTGLSLDVCEALYVDHGALPNGDCPNGFGLFRFVITE